MHGGQRPQPRQNGTVTRSPSHVAADLRARGHDRAGQLVAGDVRRRDVGVVPHPACQSERQIPVAPTSTTTPSAGGSGSGTCSTASGPPNSRKTAAPHGVRRG